jgi:hypothetical protein
MRKLIFITFLTLGICSCGSIKKHKENTETEQKENINAGSNTNRWTNSSNYNLEPVDLSKPIKFTNSKGETELFENTKVVYNNTHTREIIKDTISSKKEFNQETNKKDKETDNTMLFLGLGLGGLFLILLFFFALIFWFVNSQSKKFDLIVNQLKNNL